MHDTPIWQYLRNHGQRLDSEIASATDTPLHTIRSTLHDLSALGKVSKCSATRFANGKPLEGILHQISRTIPPKAPV